MGNTETNDILMTCKKCSEKSNSKESINFEVCPHCGEIQQKFGSMLLFQFLLMPVVSVILFCLGVWLTGVMLNGAKATGNKLLFIAFLGCILWSIVFFILPFYSIINGFRIIIRSSGIKRKLAKKVS